VEIPLTAGANSANSSRRSPNFAIIANRHAANLIGTTALSFSLSLPGGRIGRPIEESIERSAEREPFRGRGVDRRLLSLSLSATLASTEAIVRAEISVAIPRCNPEEASSFSRGGAAARLSRLSAPASEIALAGSGTLQRKFVGSALRPDWSSNLVEHPGILQLGTRCLRVARLSSALWNSRRFSEPRQEYDGAAGVDAALITRARARARLT